jgi:hypothetical protein
MPHSQAVIVYAPASGNVRSVIYPSDDSQAPSHTANIGPGEAVLVVSASDCRQYGAESLLARQLNRPATASRCAVINAAGFVVAVVPADPAIDKPPPFCRLHRDPNNKAVVGQLASNLSLLP